MQSKGFIKNPFFGYRVYLISGREVGMVWTAEIHILHFYCFMNNTHFYVFHGSIGCTQNAKAMIYDDDRKAFNFK